MLLVIRFIENSQEIYHLRYAWCCHQMETFSMLLVFCEGIHPSLVDSLTKASDTGLWCFLWSAPEHMVEQTNGMLVILDTNVLIITSLWYVASLYEVIQSYVTHSAYHICISHCNWNGEYQLYTTVFMLFVTYPLWQCKLVACNTSICSNMLQFSHNMVQCHQNIIFLYPLTHSHWWHFVRLKTDLCYIFIISVLFINGSVQDCSISSANALEILQSCTKHQYAIPYDTEVYWNERAQVKSSRGHMN